MSPLLLQTASHPSSAALSTEQHDNQFPFHQSPSELVEAALAKLSASGVELIAWDSMLYRSLKVPKCAIHFTFLVLDSQLDVASDIVSSMHLPLIPPYPLLVKVDGDLHAKGYLHRLTPESGLGTVRWLHLLPASFAGYTTSELLRDSHPTYTLFYPRASAVYASILRIMASYPRRNSPVRGLLEAELEMLINYHLLNLEVGYVDPDDEEEFQIDQRIDEAACTLRNWGADGEWRVGEEWMQDALEAVVRGSGSIEDLPWRDS